MDQTTLHDFESRCTQESPPRCRAACPFDLDARAFLARMAEGKTAEARKLLERHLPLPHVLARLCDHPCENLCLRRDLGGSIALHGLELACMSAESAAQRVLPMPPKRFRLAIVGAGLAGLAAAWDLARKSYPLTLFHQGELADTLLADYPQLRQGDFPKNFLAEDLDDLKRRKVVFEQTTPDAALVEKCAAEFDAVLLDAGACPELAPEESALDADTLRWRDKICCAGWKSRTATGHLFASASKQAGQGRRAAQSMERLAAGLSLTASRDKNMGPLHTSLAGVEASPRVEPARTLSGEPVYSPEEAAAEARRCLQCECLICARQCVYIQKYKGYPRLYARQAHNNASIVKGLHTANAMINGCALCGQCTELCPENFSMSELCLMARRDMVEHGYMPLSAHDFALEDMENASGPDCALSLPDGDAPAWLLFPGCQLAAARGEQVAALYGWLRDALAKTDRPGLALLLSCCGIPARWAGRERVFREHTDKLRENWEALGRPRIVAACSSCLSALREAIPEGGAISLWEVLDGMDLTGLREALPKGDATPAFPLSQKFSIQDPCTARHDAAWQAATRGLAKKAGAEVAEPVLTGASTACCGYGGLVWCAQPELASEMSAHRAAGLDHPALASCIMCRDRLAASGKEAWHLLDLLLPGGAKAASGAAAGPGLSARRAGRAALRRELLSRYGKPDAAADAASEASEARRAQVRVSPELLARLEERHILLNDVRDAVLAAEASGHRFLNQDNGRLLGSSRPRKVTFWVEYEKTDDGFLVADAWCHRMVVPGSGGAEAEAVIQEHQRVTDGGRRERT